ncbi:phosphatase PAP2 family protein [Methylobacterium sp. JK268]
MNGIAQHSTFRHAAAGLWTRLRLNEVGPLASLLAVSLFGFGFLKVAGEVSEGDTKAFDAKLLLALRHPGDLSHPIGPAWLPETMRDITAFGSVFGIVYVTVSVVIYIAVTRRGRAALFVAAAVGGGNLLSTLLKLYYQRPRPDLVPHGMETFTASFPSGHATLSAVTYLTLAILLARISKGRRVKALVIALGVATTLLVGTSRVYLGVHWPSDVLAGWCVGAAWAALCWFVALQLQRRRVVEAPDPPPV